MFENLIDDELNIGLKVLNSIIEGQIQYLADLLVNDPNQYDEDKEGTEKEIEFAKHFKIYIEDELAVRE